MNHLTSLRTAALAAFVFAAPATGFTKDKHHDHDHGHVAYVQPYCAPHASYGYRSYGYSSYGYRPYYYSRPSVSVGFYSAPAYSSYSYSSVPDYDYDSYPTVRTYRGVVRPSYSYRDRSSSSDELAVDVQRALARKGYYRGGIDGDIGPGTRAAIRSYQYQRGLEVTGRIDGSLLRSLGIS